jgi:hypothetical protein
MTPDGDFLIGFDDPIRVFRVENQIIQSDPITSVPNDHKLIGNFNLVMVQWALGKHVAEWESQLKSLAVTKLPDPVVDVGEMQK